MWRQGERSGSAYLFAWAVLKEDAAEEGGDDHKDDACGDHYKTRHADRALLRRRCFIMGVHKEKKSD